MSPGINDHPYNTGALPKSNRRSDRNRQIDNIANNRDSNWIANDRRHCRGPSAPPQHANNLSQVDWHPVYHHQALTAAQPSTSRSGKNSNNRIYHPTHPPAPASSTGSLDLRDLGLYNSHNHRYPNLYSQPENIIPWLKMTSPHQPPPNISEKPTNTDKMPERHQVEGRLNQIREYIKVTTSMMDSLGQSTDPKAQAQHEKLSKMVEDLYDSEQKLGKLLEESEKYWGPNENGEMYNDDGGREEELRKKIDESQRKLAQLQDHQAHLVGLQMRVRERLNEARQAQQALLASESEEQDEEEEVVLPVDRNGGIVNGQVTQNNVEELERETEALRGKLQQLETKKRQMDHLVHELQAVELGSCSSEGSRQAPGQQRDRVAELEAMKAQLHHLKTLMNEATRAQDAVIEQQPQELDHEENGAAAVASVNEEVYPIDENDGHHEIISEEDRSKPPTVEQIQSFTRELKEQQQLLLTARAELLRLKNQSSITSSSPPVEKKLSNNEARYTQNNQRQFEELNRKECFQSSLVNQNGTSSDWSNRRECNSIPNSQTSASNIWIPSTNGIGCQNHNIDTMSAQETLMEIGSQPPLDNGSNFWSMPPVITNQPPQAAVGSAEYYRQLLIGSQTQQLQMLTTTLQQCCQLLWSQQREMQSMRAAINQLQTQIRHSRTNSNEIHEEHHSNLIRPATQQHFSSIEPVTLPPSSSLPNLVSLPGAIPAPPTVISTMANCQQQQQQHQQLNNQVPPGNRANNYWDNFRSYSRQNLLSGTLKTGPEGAVAHSSSSTVVTQPQMNNKRNRQQTCENLPSQPPEVHYTLNLPHQQESTTPRNNFALDHEQQSQQNVGAEASGSLRPEQNTDDESWTRIAKMSERKDLRRILMHCLKVLENGKQNVSPLPSSNISNISDSSDDESEAGPFVNSTVAMGNVQIENQISTTNHSEVSLNAASNPHDTFSSDSSLSLQWNAASNQPTRDIDDSRMVFEHLNNEISGREPTIEVAGHSNNQTSNGDSINAEQLDDYAYSIELDIEPEVQVLSSMSLIEDENLRAEYVVLDRGSHAAPSEDVKDHHHQK